MKSQFLTMTLDHNLEDCTQGENNTVNKLEEFEKLKLRIRMLPYLLSIENKVIFCIFHKINIFNINKRILIMGIVILYYKNQN